MRWHLLVILAYVIFVLQEGLKNLLAAGTANPDFIFILMVVVASFAPPKPVVITALGLGLLADLSTVFGQTGQLEDVTLVGPACLGYLMGAWVVQQLRVVLFRDSPIALAASVSLAGIMTHLVIVAVLSLRALPWFIAQPVPGWNLTDELVGRFSKLIYTTLWALPMGVIQPRLLWFLGLSKFPPSGFSSHAGRSSR